MTFYLKSLWYFDKPKKQNVMPVLIVLGVPKKLQSLKFINALEQRVYGIEELDLKNDDDVSIIFLGEASNDVIIFVEGLFNKPERTEEVRNRLADRIAQCAKSYVKEAHRIECFIHPFDPKLGFASICKAQK